MLRPLCWPVGLLFALLVAGPETARAQAAIVITEVRFLNFGSCESIPNTTYTVDAAESPGVTGCSSSSSAKFQITGDPGAKVVISIPNNVDTSNGTETLNVKLSKAPTGGNVSFDGTGNLTVYVGGNFKIPPGGLTTSGLFFASPAPILTVVYK
jgi:hypothetical protein